MSSNKNWDRPWSTEEIIANSPNWSLAGDVALLHNLKLFSDNLIKNTSDINDNLHKLTHRLDEAGLELEIAQNKFHSLRNVQFIESRVYEDDETLPTVGNQQEKNQTENSKDHTKDIQETVSKGLDILDRYYDRIEVSISDSGSDDEPYVPNHVLRVKDLYFDRPLPFVIGSEEWHDKWHVGLEDSSSSSDTEKLPDIDLESESDDDLQLTFNRSQLKGSKSSSEFDSTKNENRKSDDLFDAPSDDDSERLYQSNAPIVSSESFAKQLSDKLGDVIGQKQIQEEDINSRPIKKAGNKDTSAYVTDLFINEPPPLQDDDDDVISEKSLFAPNTNLFDDDIWDDDRTRSTSKTVPGLFDSDDEDDLFAGATKAPPSRQVPVFDDEPPKLVEKAEKVQKPVGGVSIFGGGNLFDKKLLRRPVESSDEESETSKEKARPLPSHIISKKTINLFEDDDFSVGGGDPAKEGAKIDLFDDDDDDSSFDTNQSNVQPVKTGKVSRIGLFDDDDDVMTPGDPPGDNNGSGDATAVSLFDDDLFSHRTTDKFASNLFSDTSHDFLSKSSEKSKPSSSDLFAIQNDIPPLTIDLFVDDDVTDFENDLFGAQKGDLFGGDDGDDDEVVAPKTTRTSVSLFDDSPPPSDGGGDVEISTKSPEIVAPKTTRTTVILFNDSPPPSDSGGDHEVSTESLDIFASSPSEHLFSGPPDWLKDAKITESSDKGDLVRAPAKLQRQHVEINVAALRPGFRPQVKKTIDDMIVGGENAKLGDDGVEVLQSVTKHRARLPSSRRPSTRRGRKEALRKAQSSDDYFVTLAPDGDNPVFESQENILVEPPVVSPSSASDYIFEEPASQPIPKESSDEASPWGLFDDPKETSKKQQNLDEHSVTLTPDEVVELPKDIPPAITTSMSNAEAESSTDKVVQRGLFDEDDDDYDSDDIFTSKIKPSTGIPSSKQQRSLFDDDNEELDDDDIFKPSKSHPPISQIKKSEPKLAVDRKIAKVRKLENKKSEDDPLSAFSSK